MKPQPHHHAQLIMSLCWVINIDLVGNYCRSRAFELALFLGALIRLGHGLQRLLSSFTQSSKPNLKDFSTFRAPRTNQIFVRSTGLSGSELAVYTTNMAMPAMNIATVVIATTVHPKRELGWPCISFLSEATTSIAPRRKGANRPLMTAVQ
jgi:hypothetical protein